MEQDWIKQGTAEDAFAARPEYGLLPSRLNGHFRITDVKTKSDTVLTGYLECCGDRAFEVFYDAKLKRSLIGDYSLYATERGFAFWRAALAAAAKSAL